MGSNFFGRGGNGFLGKFNSNLAPVNKYLRFVSPGAAGGYQQGQTWANRNVVGSTPTPYAGVAPTLADSNNGYVQQARAQVPQQPNVQIPQQPRAWMGS